MLGRAQGVVVVIGATQPGFPFGLKVRGYTVERTATVSLSVCRSFALSDGTNVDT